MFVALLLVLGTSSVLRAQSVNLNDSNYQKIKNYIVPNKKEISYLDIKWRSALWDAFQEAHEKRKPVLLWAMNGHPLGHT